MIDLEQELRVALRSYADTMPPSEPPLLIAATVSVDTDDGYRRWLTMAAAVVIVVVVVGLLAVVGGRQRSVVQPSPAVGTWTMPASMPLSARQYPSVLWSGSEFIVWGGQRANVGLADGAIYDPVSDIWRPIASNDRVRPGGLAVWAGDRMVVLSGSGGEAYDPVSDRWSALPVLDGVGASNGFTDAVWTGQTLLGIGVHPMETSGASTVTVWKLDAPNRSWIAAGTTIATGVDQPTRMVSIADQFSVHDPITTDDGFVLWDGNRHGWQFSLTKGWEQLPALAQYDGTVLISNAEVVWVNEQLTAVALGQTADNEDTRIAMLEDNGWSTWMPVYDGAVLGAHPVPAGSQIVVLGVGTNVNHSPLLIDTTPGVATVMADSSLQTVIEQGVGWSGAQLLICGGQTPNSSTGSQTTSDVGPLSNHCSLWKP